MSELLHHVLLTANMQVNCDLHTSSFHSYILNKTLSENQLRKTTIKDHSGATEIKDIYKVVKGQNPKTPQNIPSSKKSLNSHWRSRYCAGCAPYLPCYTTDTDKTIKLTQS